MKNKRTKEEYEQAVKNSLSIAGVCRFLNIKPVGGNYRVVRNAIAEYGIDTSHFTGQGWNVGLKFNPGRKTELTNILKKGTYYSSFKLKNRLFQAGLKEKVCECCKRTTWNDKEIPLELHHKNGDNKDNRIENIMILCPNCHAQTDTYRGFNKGKSAQEKTPDVEVG